MAKYVKGGEYRLLSGKHRRLKWETIVDGAGEETGGRRRVPDLNITKGMKFKPTEREWEQNKDRLELVGAKVLEVSEVMATKAAIALAADAGFKMDGVKGSGPDGIIVEDDVAEALEREAESSGSSEDDSDDADDSGEGEDAPPEVTATDGAIEWAKDHGVDLATVTGTGANGRIKVGDVKAAAEKG